MLLWLMKTPTQLTDNANAWGNPRQCGKPFPLSPAPWKLTKPNNKYLNNNLRNFWISQFNAPPCPAQPHLSDFHPHPLRTSLVSFTNQESTFCKPCFWKCSNSIYKVSWWLHSSKAIHLNCQEKAAALLCKITSNPITKECNSGIRSYKSMPETQIPVIQNTLAEKLESFQFW